MSELKLIKIIPERRKTVKLDWVKQFVEMSDRYREIRAKSRRPMDSCFWCRHKFENGEMIHLAARKRGSNIVLCGKCVENEIQETGDE